MGDTQIDDLLNDINTKVSTQEDTMVNSIIKGEQVHVLNAKKTKFY